MLAGTFDAQHCSELLKHVAIVQTGPHAIMFDFNPTNTKPYLKSRPKTFLKKKRREDRSSLGATKSTRLLGRKIVKSQLPTVVPQPSHATNSSFSASTLWSNSGNAGATSTALGTRTTDKQILVGNSKKHSNVLDKDFALHKPLLLVDTNCPFRASTARQFESDIQTTFPLPNSVSPSAERHSVVYSNQQQQQPNIKVIVQLRYHESVPGAHWGSTDEPAAFCELLVSEEQLQILDQNIQYQRQMQLYLSDTLEKYFNIPNDRYYLRFLNRQKSSVVFQQQPLSLATDHASTRPTMEKETDGPTQEGW